MAELGLNPGSCDSRFAFSLHLAQRLLYFSSIRYTSHDNSRQKEERTQLYGGSIDDAVHQAWKVLGGLCKEGTGHLNWEFGNQ